LRLPAAIEFLERHNMKELPASEKRPEATRSGKLPSVPLRLYFEEWLRNMPVVKSNKETLTVKINVTLPFEQWHHISGFCLRHASTFDAAISTALKDGNASDFFATTRSLEGVDGTAVEGGVR
jgi:hypothetical protein